MQKLVAMLFIAILAGSVTLPNVFSDNEKDTDKENSAKIQENNDDKNEKVHFGFSNATSIKITLPNGTKVTFGFSNSTNAGQQISSFVHFIRDVFKQDELKEKQIIKDCREKAKNASPSERKNIMNECKTKLKEIKQQLRSEHKQLQMDFRQFQEMIIGNNQQLHKHDSEITTGNIPQTHKPNSGTDNDQQAHQNFHAKGNHENQNKGSGKIHGQSQHGNQNGKGHGHGKED
jgi:hypothetical protein